MITRAMIERAINALEQTGRKVTSLRLHPDGSIELITGGDASVAPTLEEGAHWTDFAGQQD